MLKIFSSYIHPFEKTIDKFFLSLNSKVKPERIHKRLAKLMQQNLIISNLWLEKKFKNYSKLSKSNRKQLYINAEEIGRQFDQYYHSFHLDEDHLQFIFTKNNITFPQPNIAQLKLLAAIMGFLQPGHYYEYIESASFDKLLKNPMQEKLKGDCNQIVTLYAYLFSRHENIEWLQVKLLPDHICLHILGIDIEATNATWQNYEKFDYIAPITELLSVNLLDVSDFRENTSKISEQTLLKGAQFAHKISTNRSIVERNIIVAYYNLAFKYSKSHLYKQALFYAKKVNQPQLFKQINHNATAYYLKNKQFDKARYYAKQTNQSELVKTVIQNEAAYNYNKNNFKRAQELYRKLNDSKMIKACFQKEFNLLIKKIPGNLKTIKDHRRYKSIYSQLLNLAQKGGLKEQAEQIRKLVKQL